MSQDAPTLRVTFSHDQAEAFDSVAGALSNNGVDLENGQLTAPHAGGAGQVLAVIGKAGSGKTLLLAELYRAMDDAGVQLVSGDFESRKNRDRRSLAILAPNKKGRSVLRMRGVPATRITGF